MESQYLNDCLDLINSSDMISFDCTRLDVSQLNVTELEKVHSALLNSNLHGSGILIRNGTKTHHHGIELRAKCRRNGQSTVKVGARQRQRTSQKCGCTFGYALSIVGGLRIVCDHNAECRSQLYDTDAKWKESSDFLLSRLSPVEDLLAADVCEKLEQSPGIAKMDLLGCAADYYKARCEASDNCCRLGMQQF